MEWSRKKEFNDFLIEKDVVEFRDAVVKLSSGRKSNLYVNLRKISDDIITIYRTVSFMKSFVYEIDYDVTCFIGVAEGATKLGLFLTDSVVRNKIQQNVYKKDHVFPLPMSRGKEKKHGSNRDKYYVGSLDNRVVVIEDVLTTGNSLINEVGKLRKSGINVEYALGLLDRLERRKDKLSVSEALAKTNVSYYSMTDVKSLLPLACKKKKPSQNVIKNINKYYNKYGCEKIILDYA